MSRYKILSLIGGTQLKLAEYLPEYDAIVLDPSTSLLGIPPGQETTFSYQERPKYEAIRGLHRQRASELATFLGFGGVLLVRLREPSWLYVGAPGEPAGGMNSFSWWLTPVFDALGRVSPDSAFAHPAPGTALTPTEPGHPFESYLRTINSYEVWLDDDDIPDEEGVIVLAENRARKPVAVEVACGQGVAIMVPPPTSEGTGYLLEAAVASLLDSRIALHEDWPTDEERELLDKRAQVLSEMRGKRDKIDQELVRLRDVKVSVMRLLHVERAIGYYRKATAGAPTAKSIPAIWKMQEMLREHYNRGDAGLAQLLGVSKGDMEFLDRLANTKELDVRHTTAGKPSSVLPNELQRVLGIGKALVQGLINYECRQLAAPTVTAVRANGPSRERG